jgi:Zn-dependent protease with chaperone function
MQNDALVHPKEKLYFAISLAISIFVYLALVVSVVGILYVLFGSLVALFAHGMFMGSIRGNGVRVSPAQFPDVHETTQRLSREMGMREAPDVYIVQAGGMLNAFATRFLGRNFVILYSDVVELARQQGEDALAFVICHELAHHYRKHTARRLLLLPSLWVPFLGAAYSRACEYTCDAFGAHYCGRGAVNGLLVLAAGKTLYREVNVEAFTQQARDDSFFVWLSEKLTTHPHLPKRVAHAARWVGSGKVQVGAIAPVPEAYAAQGYPAPAL